MLPSIYVIDDFCADPMALRNAALRLTYEEKVQGDVFQGRNSREIVLPDNPDRLFSELLREPLVGNPEFMHGRCRLALASDRRDADIHVDVIDGVRQGCVWAGVVYLTLDKHARGGTEFFRNRRYGTDTSPFTDEEAERVYGVRSRFTATSKLLAEEGRRRECWEHLMTIPMRFNRAVFYRPWFWHTAGEAFGDSPENGRLIQLFFLAPILPRRV